MALFPSKTFTVPSVVVTVELPSAKMTPAEERNNKSTSVNPFGMMRAHIFVEHPGDRCTKHILPVSSICCWISLRNYKTKRHHATRVHIGPHVHFALLHKHRTPRASREPHDYHAEHASGLHTSPLNDPARVIKTRARQSALSEIPSHQENVGRLLHARPCSRQEIILHRRWGLHVTP